MKGLTLYKKSVREYDPTHTTTLRNMFSRDMNKRFIVIRGLIRRAIMDDDVFGFGQERREVQREVFGYYVGSQMKTYATPGRHAFAFSRTEDKVNAFMDWLNEQVNSGLLEVSSRDQIGGAIHDAWTNKYIQSSYQSGIRQSRQELIKAGYDVPGIDITGGVDVAFNHPFHADRVGAIYTRTFRDLKGITDTMDGQISRVLSQGMMEGKGQAEIARMLTRTVTGPVTGLGITDSLGRFRFIPASRRAKMLARTEIIRAHAAATVQEYRNWGVEGVEVRAELATAGYDVCEECQDLEGRTWTLEEADGIIPVHPNCRCAFIPKPIK